MLGNTYDVSVVDLWSSHSPWPLCNMPKSYFFWLKIHGFGSLNFRCSEPKIVHETLFRVSKLKLESMQSEFYLQIIYKGYAAIVSKQFARVFMEYNPHLIVSVHPLMQHVPVRYYDQVYFDIE